MKKVVFFVIVLTCCCYVKAQIITTIAGNGVSPGIDGDGGAATAAGIFANCYATIDDSGNIYIGGYGNYTISSMASKVRKVNTSGIINTFAGIDTVGFSGDGGMATNARLFCRGSVTFDKKGNVYIADIWSNARIRRVSPTGIITTFAGNGSLTASGDGGPATAAGLGTGMGLCSDDIGNIYIAAGNKIRKVDTYGIITTYAGIGAGFYSGDGGPATAAAMTAQGQIAFDKYGNLYVAEGANQRVRKINPMGIITTIAGNGTAGFGGDGGPATAAQLHEPSGVFPDNCGNVYIADLRNNRVRVVNGSGMIKTFAGDGSGTSSGDGGLASAAKVWSPKYIYLDQRGNILISETVRVRYIQMDSCRNTTEVPVNAITAAKFTIFPNPAAGAFTLNLSSPINEPVEVVITNMVGEKVKESTTNTNKETAINLHAPPGVYFVQVSTASGKWVQKLLVE